MNIIKCKGCGAIIQSKDTNVAGYIPENKFNSDNPYCQRCFKIKNYNKPVDSNISEQEFIKILDSIGEKDCLVVYIVDIFDFNGSLISGLTRHINNNDILVLANKRDLLSKEINDNKIINWLQYSLKQENIIPKNIILTSAIKNYNLDIIFDEIDYLSNGRDVYVVGTTNVGKSTLINSFLKSYLNSDQFITTSYYPGTTLDLISVQLQNGSHLYDTPGIINKSQFHHWVEETDLVKISPKKEIKPKVYQLENNQSIYIGGLARFDNLSNDKNNFVFYFSNGLKLHRTKTSNADELFNRNKQLAPLPKEITKIEEFKTYSFDNKGVKMDIVIDGLGFVTLPATTCNVNILVPSGVLVTTRKAFI